MREHESLSEKRGRRNTLSRTDESLNLLPDQPSFCQHEPPLHYRLSGLKLSGGRQHRSTSTDKRQFQSTVLPFSISDSSILMVRMIGIPDRKEFFPGRLETANSSRLLWNQPTHFILSLVRHQERYERIHTILLHVLTTLDSSNRV